MSDADLMAQLRDVMLGMTDSQLSTIGVTIDRTVTDDGEWMVEAFIETLNRQGRDRAAKSLAKSTGSSGAYTLALDRQFFGILATVVRMRLESTHHTGMPTGKENSVPPHSCPDRNRADTGRAEGRVGTPSEVQHGGEE